MVAAAESGAPFQLEAGPAYQPAPPPNHWPAAPPTVDAPDTAKQTQPAPDTRSDVPIAAFTYTASSAPERSMDAQSYALTLLAAGQRGTLGGGVTVWGAPFTRLTLVADAQRNAWGNFSPSAAVIVNVLGDAREGWSLGALGKFKIDGFASGPHKDEIESEVELGALVSFNHFVWHLDVNAIAGKGTGDDGETDTEARLRLGYDLGQYARLGLDGQTRVRVGGPKYLPNGRIWDFAAGPQFFLGTQRFFGVLSAGPATTGVIGSNVAFLSVLSIGGTT